MKKPIRNSELEAMVEAVESDSTINLKVPEKLINPHPLVVGMKYPKQQSTRFNTSSNKIFNEGETLDFAVSKKNLQRAMLILDTFIRAVEKRGHSVVIKGGSTYVIISGEPLRIRFWEKSRYIENHDDKRGFRDTELTGEFFIQYFKISNYVERQWGDTAHTKLEDKLGRVIGSLEYFGKKEHEERLEREAYWKKQREKEAIQKELNARKQTEFNNFKILLSQSLRYEKAQAIRAFVSHIEANPHLTIEGSDNLQEWMHWARAKADWYDPTVESKDEVLSPFGEFHEDLLFGKKEIDGFNVKNL
jgi:hypothetical protein